MARTQKNTQNNTKTRRTSRQTFFVFFQRHAKMFVQVYANPFIGEQIMNI